MSADSWTECPRCALVHAGKITKATALAEKSYGKVSSEEFFRRSAEARRVTNEVLEETFREDYEIGLVGHDFIVAYTGRCLACGLEFSYKHTEAIPVPAIPGGGPKA